ncbi:OVARIAN TUMOR DOMAIN-containing deubiquitinating enzyme 1-like [Musa acuminata AAA Group]|uniref:OVARIAN TUMOR DOMAIN-containing deubiquitinating enzyme 1-like n=1 Tax=Musa acuminata AAA Group TaxID=214697 RepID=UPI0031D40415
MEVSSKKQKVADDDNSSGSSAEGDEPMVTSQSFISSTNVVNVTVSSMGEDEFRDFIESSHGTSSDAPSVTPPIGNVASSTGTASHAPSVTPPIGNVGSSTGAPSDAPSVTPPIRNLANKFIDIYEPYLPEDFIQNFPDVGDQVADDNACVGHKEPLSSLVAEFQSGSPIIQAKIKLLYDNYAALRRVRKDGNCFYRSFMFSYLEHILETQDTAEVDRILANIEQCRKAQLVLGDQEYRISEIFSLFIDLLKSVIQENDNSISHELLLEKSCDQMFSDTVVLFFRMVTSGELRIRAEFFAPFAGVESTGMAKFCQDSVEMMGEDCDHVHITALCDALGVPTRVECLDQSTSSSGDLTPKHHDFIPMQSSASDAGNPPVPRVTLLYRPGHYDILYPK